MPTLDDFHASQVALDAKVDALITAYNGQKDAITALTAQVVAAQGDPAKIQAAIDDATAESAKIDSTLGTAVPPVVPPIATV